MGASRRVRKRCATVFAIFVAATGVALGFGGTAGAAHLTVTSLAGSAFGIEAGGELLTIERTPFVEIGPGAGSESDETLSVEAADLIGADVFPVMTEGQIGPNGFVESSAQVANVQIGDLSDDTGGGLLDLGGILDDLLGGGGTLGLGGLFDDLFGGTLSADVIRSECESRLGFEDAPNTPGSRGQTEIVGLEVLGGAVGEEGALLNLDDNPLLLALEDALDIDLALLRVVVNEQVESTDADSTAITVNALRLTVLGDADTTDANAVDDDALLDIIIAQSRCALNFAPTQVTTTTVPGPTTTVLGPTTTVPGPTTTVPGPGNDATNDSDISNDSDGTAVIETGDANAVGNISDTEINQTAAGGNVDQDAAVVNQGTAEANTGDNTAIGNNSVNVVENRQSAVASDAGTTTTGTIPGHNNASNTSSASNTSNGTAAIETGDADAVGNVSDTEVNQTADATGGFFGGGVDQDAAVANVGDANANTGGNTAIGNNSTNVASNDQTAVAVGDNGVVDPCCPQPEGANAAGNTSTAANTSDGTAAISTGDADAAGNISETAIGQNASVTGSAPCGGTCTPPPCGGTCPPPPCGECPQPCPDPEPECPQECPDDNPCERQPCGGTCGNPWTYGFGWSSVSQSATVVNSGSASANTGGNTAIGNNSTNVATNRQTAVAADDD